MTAKKSLDKSKIKILVCCHKPCELPKDDIFLPIHCGKALSDLDLGMQGDNEVNGMPCDNISEKNDTYCELTAMYWAWKNIKKLYPDIEYIGLNHYRRYFDFEKNPFRGETVYISENDIKRIKINKKFLSQILFDGKIIVPKKRVTPQLSLKNEYAYFHHIQDYKTLNNIIFNDFPQYANTFLHLMEEQNKIIHYNMFIMPYTTFCEYCSWIFDVLSVCEKKIPYKTYDTYQKRVMGYMAERLFNVWLYHNKFRLRYLSILLIETSANFFFKNLIKYIKYILKQIYALFALISNHMLKLYTRIGNHK